MSTAQAPAQAQPRKIVVGVDLSDTGDHALRVAMELARGIERSELHPTYVITDKGGKNIEELSNRLTRALEDIRSHIATVCAPPRGEQPFSQETVLHVRLGQPAAAIHQVAVDVDAEMIVVGTHARTGVEKLLLGSVAEELVREAHMPVLVAHPKEIDGLPRSERVEPPRPGEDLSVSHGLTRRLHLEFVPRTSHISGLL